MPFQPSRRVEHLLAALLPPNRREHVLGDLREYTDTSGQFIGEFLAALPRIVASEIRRKLRAGTGLGLMAALSATAILVAAIVSSGRSLAVPGEWLRWAAPWVAWTAGCVMAAAYGTAGTTLWSGWGVLIAFVASVAAAFLSGAHVGAVTTALVAATVAHMAITLPRVAPDLWRAAAAGPPLSLDNVHERARKLQRTVWWRNARESAAAIVLLVVNGGSLLFSGDDSAIGWVVPALGSAGLVYILYFLHVKAAARRVPEGLDAPTVLRFHLQEIARQREVLRTVPYWYLLPLVPGVLARIIAKWHPVSGPLAILLVAAAFYGIGRLNVWGARWLDGQLVEAQALDAKSPR